VNYKIAYTPEFGKEVKKLSKKYASLKLDLKLLLEHLANNPHSGVPLGNHCYKIRLAISSKNKGKSGGARIITYVAVVEEIIVLVSIYDKSEQSIITDKEVKERLKKYL
jgi:mRNA-degrading endonuclease RelE of RelBE toxin-antitoxin system